MSKSASLSVAHILGDYVARTGQPISDATRNRAVHAIVDTVAVICAGHGSSEGRSALSYGHTITGPKTAAVIGHNATFDVQTAALVNGVLGHALDFDDCIAPMPGHPSALVVPVLASGCAMAAESITGKEFVDAYITGIELGTRLGELFGMSHYQQGWHSTGTIAIFSGIAALARLLRLDQRLASAALGLGTSMASGLQVQFGTSAKPLHTGLAARNAVAAVQLAQSGFQPSDVAFEGSSGFFDVFGTDHVDFSGLSQTLGSPYVIDEPGSQLKAYPCCNAIHRAIDGLLELTKAHSLSTEQVRSIEVLVPPGGLRPLRVDEPTTGTEAKFHMGFVLAAALIDQRVSLETFSPKSLARVDIRREAQHIFATESADHQAVGETLGSIGSRGWVEVRVGLRDGRTVSAIVKEASGMPGRALDRNQLTEKFRSCVTFGGVDHLWAAELLEHLWTLPTLAEIPPLGTPFVPGGDRV